MPPEDPLEDHTCSCIVTANTVTVTAISSTKKYLTSLGLRSVRYLCRYKQMTYDDAYATKNDAKAIAARSEPTVPAVISFLLPDRPV